MSEAIRRSPGIGAGSLGGVRLPSLKRALLALVAAGGVAVAADLGVQYWQAGRFQVSTDDAYVQADSITIAPRVAG